MWLELNTRFLCVKPAMPHKTVPLSRLRMNYGRHYDSEVFFLVGQQGPSYFLSFPLELNGTFPRREITRFPARSQSEHGRKPSVSNLKIH